MHGWYAAQRMLVPKQHLDHLLYSDEDAVEDVRAILKQLQLKFETRKCL